MLELIIAGVVLFCVDLAYQWKQMPAQCATLTVGASAPGTHAAGASAPDCNIDTDMWLQAAVALITIGFVIGTDNFELDMTIPLLPLIVLIIITCLILLGFKVSAVSQDPDCKGWEGVVTCVFTKQCSDTDPRCVNRDDIGLFCCKTEKIADMNTVTQLAVITIGALVLIFTDGSKTMLKMNDSLHITALLAIIGIYLLITQSSSSLKSFIPGA